MYAKWVFLDCKSSNFLVWGFLAIWSMAYMLWILLGTRIKSAWSFGWRWRSVSGVWTHVGIFVWNGFLVVVFGGVELVRVGYVIKCRGLRGESGGVGLFLVWGVWCGKFLVCLASTCLAWFMPKRIWAFLEPLVGNGLRIRNPHYFVHMGQIRFGA